MSCKLTSKLSLFFLLNTHFFTGLDLEKERLLQSFYQETWALQAIFTLAGLEGDSKFRWHYLLGLVPALVCLHQYCSASSAGWDLSAYCCLEHQRGYFQACLCVPAVHCYLVNPCALLAVHCYFVNLCALLVVHRCLVNPYGPTAHCSCKQKGTFQPVRGMNAMIFCIYLFLLSLITAGFTQMCYQWLQYSKSIYVCSFPFCTQ